MYLIIDSDNTENCYFKITDLVSNNLDDDEKAHFWDDFELETYLVDYFHENELEKISSYQDADEYINEKWEELLEMSWEQIINNWIVDDYLVVKNLSELNQESKFYREEYKESSR